MQKSKEDLTKPIKLTISEDEFICNIVAELTDVAGISDIIHKDPTFILAITMIGMEIWNKLEEYSRMQIVADKLMNMKED